MIWKERVWRVLLGWHQRRLLRGMRKIASAPESALREEAFVADIIRGVGLRRDRRFLYGKDNLHMNFFGPGLWQIPQQLAATLVFLSRQPLHRVLEIGASDGWTTSLMAAYLQRFQPKLQFSTVDIAGRFHSHPAVNALVPIAFSAAGTSEDFAGQVFDLVFIDGNHNYEWVAKDYERVGRSAPLCMFHDIDDRRVGAENVPRFWKDLKDAEKDEAEFHEFLGPAGVMGIGVRKKLTR